MERGGWDGGVLEVDSTRLANALARGNKGKEDSKHLLVFGPEQKVDDGATYRDAELHGEEWLLCGKAGHDSPF